MLTPLIKNLLEAALEGDMSAHMQSRGQEYDNAPQKEGVFQQNLNKKLQAEITISY